MYQYDNVCVTLRLTQNFVSALRSIFLRSNREMVEYCGSSYFDGFKFVYPTCVTDHKPTSVTPAPCDTHQYVVYHTHIVPHCSEGDIFTLPSRDDVELFLTYHPFLQQNLILEKHGYYLIDFMANGFNKPSIEGIMQTFEELKSVGGLNQREVRIGHSVYFKSDIAEWKFAVSEMNKILSEKHGMNMRYHSWDELGTVTLYDHDFLS